MKWQNQRKAFSMLTAIVVIVLMATVAMLVMSMSAKLVKETTAQYQREQAVLLANSYTEYAVLAVTGNNRTVNCLETIKGTVGDATALDPNNGYRIRTHIAYIGIDDATDPTGISKCAGTRILGTVPVGSDTPLTIIVDAYVDYKDLDNPDGPNMTYHKRTVQKI